MVMSCSRSACENIMCDTYVNGIGYVCNDCQKEFKQYLNKEGIEATTETEIHTSLEVFMETTSFYYPQRIEMNVDEFFKSYTQD